MVGTAPAAAVDPAVEQAAIERQIRSLRGNKPIARLGNGPLRALFDLAIEHGRKDLCDETLDAMRTRARFQPAVRFDSAIRATGLADDAKLAALLQTLFEVPHIACQRATTTHARSSAWGKARDAEAEYTRVIASDRGATPYYAMWADLRLWSMRSSTRETCIPQQAPILTRKAGKAAAEGTADANAIDAGQLARLRQRRTIGADSSRACSRAGRKRARCTDPTSRRRANSPARRSGRAQAARGRVAGADRRSATARRFRGSAARKIWSSSSCGAKPPTS